MSLDVGVCSRARLARDARFDGKFYIAVLTTRIYCRPICRSRTSRERNVTYFPTAAAAAEAGFRPCLRCRPECSPGTAVWAGTKNTVSRALRLINESGLEEGGIETLAQHLGLGSRHLRRLFLRHLGATPRAVAQTRRLQFAKKLIDETVLPMTQVAIASGFGSVRRFNAAISAMYRRTPTDIRSRAPRGSIAPSDHHYLLQLDFRPPYAWPAMLDALKSRAIPGVEAVDGNGYRRSISVSGAIGHLEVTLHDTRNALDVKVRIDEPRLLFYIIERVRAMFDLDADWPAIEDVLKSDPELSSRMSARPGLRVPGCWNGLELAVGTLLGLAVDPARAAGIAGRMAAAFGTPASFAPGLAHVFPSAEVLAKAELERIGLPAARADAIRGLACAVVDGRIGFEKIADPASLAMKLGRMPGFDRIAVEYVAMRALREPDAFPLSPSDMGLETLAELERRSSGWCPWRAYAAAYIQAG